MNFESDPLTKLHQPTGIQLHLTTGSKRMFYQENEELVANICNDLDGHIFTRPSLIIEGLDDVTAIPGHALTAITILADPLPDSFYERERSSKTVVTQISREAFEFRRLQYLIRLEGIRGPTLSEIEFVSGEQLFLEFSEVGRDAMMEREAMNHLFSKSSLTCRRLDGGFTVWNTAHIVAWTHYPKMEVPANSWIAESLAHKGKQDSKIVTIV